MEACAPWARGREVEALEGERRRLGGLRRRRLRRGAAVVRAPLVGMTQRLVGLDDAAEERFRLLVARVHLRVVPAGEPPVRPADVAERRTATEAEGDVEVHGRLETLCRCVRSGLLLVFDHLGVDHVAVAGGAAAARRPGAARLLGSGRRRVTARRGLRLAIEHLGDLVLRLGQLLDALLDGVLIVLLERRLERL